MLWFDCTGGCLCPAFIPDVHRRLQCTLHLLDPSMRPLPPAGSKLHSQIQLQPDGSLVLCSSSSHKASAEPAHLNGRALGRAAAQVLQNGDEIRIGSATFRVDLVAVQDVEREAAPPQPLPQVGGLGLGCGCWGVKR